MRQVLNRSMIVMAAASGILSAAGGYAHADSSADGVAVDSSGVGSGNVVQVPVHVPVNVCGNTVNVVAMLNPTFGNTCANVDSGDKRDADAPGASAEGAAVGSPGVLSGNLVQVPVDVPVNACGNTVDVVGLLNPAGNFCANGSGHEGGIPPVQPPTVEPPTVEIPPVQPPTVEIPPVRPPTVEFPPFEPPNVEFPPLEPPNVEIPPFEPPTVEIPPVQPPTVEIPPVQPPTVEPPTVEPPAFTPVPNTPAPNTPAPNTPDTQLARTGAGDIGLAAGASAALLLGGTVLMRRTRGARH
jgi:hypothetical protein